MLVVMSDTHLQDTTLSGLPNRVNVPVRAFERFFEHVAARARRCRAREIIILLNGDIFDFLRTERWFTDGFAERPYKMPISSAVEAKLLEIWGGIRASNRRAMDILHQVATGTDPFDFPVPVRFAYVAGNHDRLVNISPALRRKVHEFFNLAHRDDPLQWHYTARAYGVFARHGHEYDANNCEYNFTFRRRGVPLREDLYWETPLGDWVTLDVATYLRIRFRELYGDHPLFDHLYPRICAIDDVRPPSRVVPWLQEVGDSREAERMVAETFRLVCLDRGRDPFLKAWHASHARWWLFDRTRVQSLLFAVCPPLLKMLPARTIRIMSDTVTQAKARPAWRLAAREAILDRPDFRYIVSGHFHTPRAVLLRKTAGGPVIYFCTGTWRSRFEECRQDGRFVQVQTLHYLTFFRPDEGRDHVSRPESTNFSIWDERAVRSAFQPSTTTDLTV